MSCSIVKVNGEPNSTLLMEYIMDSEADVSSLPVNVADGSISYTKDLSCIYVHKGGSWVKVDGIEVDPDAVAEAVAAWLDEHPEATTTVQDGAISYAKLNSSLQGTVDDVGDLKTAMNAVENAVDDLEAGSLSALGASSGQVPVADGEGSWAWGSGGGDVSDVQVNGTSVVTDGVANVPQVTTWDEVGVVKIVQYRGLGFEAATGALTTSPANSGHIKSGVTGYAPIIPFSQHESTFYGLAKAAGADMKDIQNTTVGTYPETQKSAISQMLNAAEQVSGSTPSITAKAGVRYVCGECATLAITLPASGIVDVVFASGSTPTVLTVTPPTGVTAVKWANGFDPTSLDANTTYEINVMDGEFGVVGTWT